ncbi:PREDICTED: histone-lysine N-methyltransferase SETMAR-like [Atta colombica]|uniref:histone-lysine N-methyltransferase SETMAR-like n=1 Tax=Atta colombica TaxID=520822 RepID=UPI00084C26B8|nr:PREDICTED: histone-lysine N-methyltransferase SETMAR-like [Atta colombica]
MENFEEHILHILFYYFKKGKKATEAREKLRRVYGRNVVKERQCQNWFARFRDGDFSVKDAHRSGMPSKIDDDEMKALVQANKHSTVRELVTVLKVSVGSVHGHLK